MRGAARQVCLPPLTRVTAGALPGVGQDRRIKYARDVLQRHFLPHITTGDIFETRKGTGFAARLREGAAKRRRAAYFLGHMINKLLTTKLGRRPFDDRDHYGNKRSVAATCCCCARSSSARSRDKDRTLQS